MLSSYRIVWIFVFFDLPTETKAQKKALYLFRKGLLKDGFMMMQFSVYVRHCADRQNAETHIGRLKSFLPGEGKVSILQVTDKQYGEIQNFFCRVIKKNSSPKQLEIF